MRFYIPRAEMNLFLSALIPGSNGFSPHLYPNIFGSHPPNEGILDAYGIEIPPDPVCYGKVDGECLEWHEDENGGIALKALNDSMAGKTEWMAQYPPTEENEPFVLVNLIHPNPMTGNFLHSLIASIQLASDRIKRHEKYDSLKMITGIHAILLYLNSDCELASILKQVTAAHTDPFEWVTDDAVLREKEVILVFYELVMSLSFKWEGSFLSLMGNFEIIACLRKREMFADLAITAIIELIESLFQRGETSLRYLYAIFIDWQLANKETLLKSKMVFDLAQLMLSSHGEGEWETVEPILRSYFIDVWEQRRVTKDVLQICRLAIPQTFIDCEANLKVPSFTDVFQAIWKGKELPEQTLVSPTLLTNYQREMGRLETWYKIRLILHHSGLAHGGIPLQDVQHLVVLQRELRANQKLFEAYRHDLLNLISSEGLKMASQSIVDPNLCSYLSDCQKNFYVYDEDYSRKVASLSILLFTGKISMEDLVATLPRYSPYYKSLAAVYADAIVKELNHPLRELLTGGYTDQTILIFMDAIRVLLLHPQPNCPIPRELLIDLMRQILIFHLVSFEMRTGGEGRLHRFFVDQLQFGDALFLPGRVFQHAFAYSIKRQSQDKYLMRVFNSGYGIKSHRRLGRDLYMPFREFIVTKQILEHYNYCFNYYAPTDKIYEFGYPVIGREVHVKQGRVSGWAKGTQKSGSCHGKSISIWLRMQWKTPLQGLWFKAFRLNLHAEVLKEVFSNFKDDFEKLPLLTKRWPIDDSKEACEKLWIENVPLDRSIVRHYSLRLLYDLFRLPGDDRGAKELVTNAVADDKDLRDCLGVEAKKLSFARKETKVSMSQIHTIESAVDNDSDEISDQEVNVGEDGKEKVEVDEEGEEEISADDTGDNNEMTEEMTSESDGDRDELTEESEDEDDELLNTGLEGTKQSWLSWLFSKLKLSK